MVIQTPTPANVGTQALKAIVIQTEKRAVGILQARDAVVTMAQQMISVYLAIRPVMMVITEPMAITALMYVRAVVVATIHRVPAQANAVAMMQERISTPQPQKAGAVGMQQNMIVMEQHGEVLHAIYAMITASFITVTQQVMETQSAWIIQTATP